MKRPAPKREMMEKWLIERFAGRLELWSDKIVPAAKRRGFELKRLYRAADKLGIIRGKRVKLESGRGSRTLWKRPAQGVVD